jgi:hypothetical protein
MIQLNVNDHLEFLLLDLNKYKNMKNILCIIDVKG